MLELDHITLPSCEPMLYPTRKSPVWRWGQKTKGGQTTRMMLFITVFSVLWIIYLHDAWTKHEIDWSIDGYNHNLLTIA